jgi:hypothetical protein
MSNFCPSTSTMSLLALFTLAFANWTVATPVTPSIPAMTAAPIARRLPFMTRLRCGLISTPRRWQISARVWASTAFARDAVHFSTEFTGPMGAAEVI